MMHAKLHTEAPPDGAGVTHLPVERIHELDGLRGMLALFVVVYHLLGPLTGLTPVLAIWMPVLLQGWYAVDVFFLMSGFVMMYVYGKQFHGPYNWGAFRAFMWARGARLYPVHLFALFATLLLLLPMFLKGAAEFFTISGRYSLGAFVSSLLMLQSPWLDYRSWNYPAWSISAEWHAYLIFPLLVPLLHKLNWRPALAVVAAGVVIPLLVYLQGVGPDRYPSNGLPVLLRVLPLFIAGMAMYRIWPQVRRVGDGWALLAVIGTLLCLWFEQCGPLAVLLVPLLVLATLRQRWLRGCFSSAPLLWLGKVSYSLYMTHALVEGATSFALRLLARHQGAGWAPSATLSAAVLLLDIGAALLLGWLTWKWIEVPGRNFLIRRLRTRALPAVRKPV
jgi:peptidoglycan/LPS O-acetylase OafA/YrhL